MSSTQSKEKLSISIITCGEIVEYYTQVEANINEAKILPISPLRALAHHNNPVADTNDPCLLVANRGKEVVGYLGIMPGQLKLSGETYKIFWFTTWYVSDSERKSMAGIKLIMKLQKLKLDLFVTGISPEAEEVYKGMKFSSLAPFRYQAVALNFKNPFYKLLHQFQLSRFNFLKNSSVGTSLLNFKKRAVANMFRFMVNGFISTQQQNLSNTPKNLIFKEVKRIEHDQPMEFGKFPIYFNRDKDYVNWMLQYPWVTDDQSAKEIPYQFSYKREQFRFAAFEIFEGDKYIGFVVYSMTKEDDQITLKLLDYSIDKAHMMALISKALELSKQHNVGEIILPQELGEHLSEDLKSITHILNRPYYCYIHTEAIKLQIGWIDLNFTDGDLAFV